MGIPKPLNDRMNEDPYYRFCARQGEGNCKGRITREHALIYAGRQINEYWAIIPLCWFHHLGEGLDKRMNEFIALERATVEDLEKYPRVDWEQKKRFLNSLFGAQILLGNLNYAG